MPSYHGDRDVVDSVQAMEISRRMPGTYLGVSHNRQGLCPISSRLPADAFRTDNGSLRRRFIAFEELYVSTVRHRFASHRLDLCARPRLVFVLPGEAGYMRLMVVVCHMSGRSSSVAVSWYFRKDDSQGRAIGPCGSNASDSGV